MVPTTIHIAKELALKGYPIPLYSKFANHSFTKLERKRTLSSFIYRVIVETLFEKVDRLKFRGPPIECHFIKKDGSVAKGSPINPVTKFILNETNKGFLIWHTNDQTGIWDKNGDIRARVDAIISKLNSKTATLTQIGEEIVAALGNMGDIGPRTLGGVSWNEFKVKMETKYKAEVNVACIIAMLTPVDNNKRKRETCDHNDSQEEDTCGNAIEFTKHPESWTQESVVAFFERDFRGHQIRIGKVQEPIIRQVIGKTHEEVFATCYHVEFQGNDTPFLIPKNLLFQNVNYHRSIGEFEEKWEKMQELQRTKKTFCHEIKWWE